jgi:GTPase SAR1 family protein
LRWASFSLLFTLLFFAASASAARGVTAVMQLRKAARVLLVGAPGVGKGTQSERLLKRFPQLQSISTGDLLRHNVTNRTPLGMN